MANAEVYYRFGSDGGWNGPYGQGQAKTTSGQHIADVETHAERQAWKEAWKTIKVEVMNDHQKSNHICQVEVKIVVDQQVCPDCQKWMVVHVLRHLGQLACATKLFAEVTRTVNKKKTSKQVQVRRDTVWPTDVGNQEKVKL